MSQHKVKTISDLKLMFHRNERPIYFISATNFNLLGLDRWVNRFKYISYIDCFDGRHPNVFVPPETPHDEFESIEDITNHLLQHKDVVDMIERRGGNPVATFLMFDEKTEALCQGDRPGHLVSARQAAPALRQQDGNRAHRQQGRRAFGAERAGEGGELQAPAADLRPHRPGP